MTASVLFFLPSFYCNSYLLDYAISLVMFESGVGGGADVFGQRERRELIGQRSKVVFNPQGPAALSC